MIVQLIGYSYWSDSPCICPMVKSLSSRSMPEHRTCFTLNWQNWVQFCCMIPFSHSDQNHLFLANVLFRLFLKRRITIMSVSWGVLWLVRVSCLPAVGALGRCRTERGWISLWTSRPSISQLWTGRFSSCTHCTAETHMHIDYAPLLVMHCLFSCTRKGQRLINVKYGWMWPIAGFQFLWKPSPPHKKQFVLCLVDYNYEISPNWESDLWDKKS